MTTNTCPHESLNFISKTERVLDVEPLELKNYGDVVELDMSEGNHTDRSSFRRALNASLYQ